MGKEREKVQLLTTREANEKTVEKKIKSDGME